MTQRTKPTPERTDRSWLLSAVAGVGVIWLMVVAVSFVSVALWVGVLAIDSFFADLLTEAERNGLAFAAFGVLLSGFVATVAFLWTMMRLRTNTDNRGTWIGLGLAAVVIWVVAALLTYVAAASVTGSLTQLAWALVGPSLGAAVLTGGASAAAASLRRKPTL